jgi:hypothetical protein
MKTQMGEVMKYSDVELREAMVECALAEWDRCVLDTQGAIAGSIKRITEYYVEVGGWWPSYIKENGGGQYTEVFVQDGTKKYMSWCGIFVGWCGLNLGRFLEDHACINYRVKPKVAELCLASTYRLNSREKWTEQRVIPPARYEPHEIQRGDIVVVGDDKHYGDHITLALYAPNEDGQVFTLSGNVWGKVPCKDGRREGVVKTIYDLDDVTRVYRLTKDHFTTKI